MTITMENLRESRPVTDDDPSRASIIEISWGDKRISVAVDESSILAHSLYERLTEFTGVPYERIRLIHAGKVLSKDSRVLRGWRLRMIGTSVELSGVYDSLVMDDLSKKKSQRRRYVVNASELYEKENGRLPLTKYGFRSIETLPGLPHEETARSILTDLARDPGIRNVMEKYGWTVGTLCEMYPEGYVGVSDVCVMGLNENRGNRIFLRLRTDDLRGFRKVLSIRKVLYHELAHNRHDDHDDAFFMLMREIEKEAERGDWRSSKSFLSGHAPLRGRFIQTQQLYGDAHLEAEYGQLTNETSKHPNENGVIERAEQLLDQKMEKTNNISDDQQSSNLDGTELCADCNHSVDEHRDSFFAAPKHEECHITASRLIDAADSLFLQFQNDDSSVQPRLVRLHDAVLAVLRGNSIADARETLFRIHEIVTNVRRSSDSKFATLRKANKLLKRYRG